MSLAPPENKSLAALPASDSGRLIARMHRITFEIKGLLYRNGGPMTSVYFPCTGMISSVVTMLDGQSAEVAVSGREGMLGVTTGFGAVTSTEEVFCQIPPSECLKLSVAEFTAELARNGAFREIIHAYLRATLTASSRAAACNSLHDVEERMARWLLLCHYRV